MGLWFFVRGRYGDRGVGYRCGYWYAIESELLDGSAGREMVGCGYSFEVRESL